MVEVLPATVKLGLCKLQRAWPQKLDYFFMSAAKAWSSITSVGPIVVCCNAVQPVSGLNIRAPSLPVSLPPGCRRPHERPHQGLETQGLNQAIAPGNRASHVQQDVSFGEIRSTPSKDIMDQQMVKFGSTFPAAQG